MSIHVVSYIKSDQSQHYTTEELISLLVHNNLQFKILEL